MPDRTNDDEPALKSWDGTTNSSTTQYTLSASDAIPGYWYKFVVEAHAEGMNPSWSQWIYCYLDEGHLEKAVISSPAAWSEIAQGNSITVKWGSVAGASGYRVHIKQLSGAPDTSNENEPAINTWRVDRGVNLSYKLSSDNVQGGYWYKFVVETCAANMPSSWSKYVYVYVPENGELDRPVITSPVAGQNCEPGKSIRFTWGKVTNATSYTYYVKQLAGEPNNSDNERAVQSWSGNTGSTGRSFTLQGQYVQPNTWYKFVVSAQASGYDTSWSRYTYIKIPDREDWIYYVLPAGMTDVSEEAFSGNKLLRTFDASASSLYSIESQAFANCINLKSINLPDTVQYIADDAFYNCTSLTIHCISGSYAESYAHSKGIPVEVHGIAMSTDIVKLSETEWNIPTKDAAYTAIRVNSSGTWQASVSASWLTIDKRTGSDSENIIISAARNTGSASRSAAVTFTSGNAKATLKVIQNSSATQNCVLELSPDYWEPSADALEREIVVRNDAGFTVTSDSAWLTYTVSNATVTARVTSASLTSARTGKLTITCSECGASKTVTVSTKGNVVPVPTGVKVTTVDPEALTVSWNAVSGASYYVERSSDGQSGWAKIKTVGSGVGTISFMDSGLSAGMTYYYRVFAQKTVSGSTITSSASAASSGRTSTQTALRFTGRYGNLSDGGRDTLANLSTVSWQTINDEENEKNIITYKISLRNLDTNTIVSGWDKKDVGKVSSYTLSSTIKDGVRYQVWVGAYNQYAHLVGQTKALKFTVQSTVVPVADDDLLVEYLKTILSPNEGTYNTVNENDNGSMSIGKLQWNANAGRAKPLLKRICDANPSQAYTILGETLYNEITDTSISWNSANRKATADETSKLKLLLATSESKQIQDSLEAEELKAYLKVGRDLGLTDNKVLLYFGDCYNYGPAATNTVAKKAIEEVGNDPALVTLDVFDRLVRASKVIGDNVNQKNPKIYVNRHNTVYAKVLEYFPEKPLAKVAPVIKLKTDTQTVCNNGNGHVTMTFIYTYADEFTVQLLQGSTPVRFTDPWVDGTVRKYDYTDFGVSEGNVYTTASVTKTITPIVIPQNTAIGTYTLLVTATNRDGFTSSDSISIKVTDISSDVVIAIAEEEVGYKEKISSSSNLESKTEDAGSGNYTKYAYYFDKLRDSNKYFYNYEKNGYEWCDIFVDWCFVQAYGYEEAQRLLCQPEYSSGAGTQYSYNYYAQKKRTGKTPTIGAQIFFDNDRECKSYSDIDHTGLVYAVKDGKVYTIEGNSSNQVSKCEYFENDTRIFGYGYPAY